MQQNALKTLEEWRGSPRRRPLVVLGPRLVGKTTLVKDFMERSFERTAYVTFSKNPSMRKVFQGSLEAERLVNAISAATGVPVDDGTAIVLDDVQECPRAVTALRQFREQRPNLAVAAIGSASQDTLRQQAEFPDGKVDVLNLHPLTFNDFLRATGKRALANLLEARDFDAMDAAAERFTEQLRVYLYVGGMPKAVAAWNDTHDYAKVRAAQQRLLDECDLHFARSLRGIAADRVRAVWESMPRQLTGENKKFMYNAVGKGGRARTHQDAVEWLVESGLATCVNRIDRPGIPLASHVDARAFRLFLLDVGLLAAALDLPASAVMDNRLFDYANGALTLQYVCQQLVATDRIQPRYWSAERSGGEVDFVYGHHAQVVPLQACAQVNRRAKSLRTFAQRHGLDQALRLSLEPRADEGWAVNLPLYAANILPDLE